METIIIWILSALLGNLDQQKLVWVIAVLAALYAFEQVIAKVPWIRANSTCELIFDIVNALYSKFRVRAALILILVLFPAFAFAAGPFLVCAPDPGVTSFNVYGLPATINATNLPVDSTGTYGFKLDISALPPGSYTVTAAGCSSDPMWPGCSSPSPPLSFTRPAIPASPTGLGLSVK